MNNVFNNVTQPKTNSSWGGGGNMNYMQSTPQMQNQTSYIPVRVVFSPEQIAPQEIPTNGSPALFPLSDGSRIIVKSLLPNGMFDEQIYVLQKNEAPQQQEKPMSDFDQVINRLGHMEEKMNQIMQDLYGNKNEGQEVANHA